MFSILRNVNEPLKGVGKNVRIVKNASIERMRDDTICNDGWVKKGCVVLGCVLRVCLILTCARFEIGLPQNVGSDVVEVLELHVSDTVPLPPDLPHDHLVQTLVFQSGHGLGGDGGVGVVVVSVA